MMTFYYIVETLDGDYANLKRTDTNNEEVKIVARALLPEEIQEGSFLKYENLEYILLKK
ncbi:MAG: chorismate--pyruvate lyase [Eubacteriales bacterium]|nr:chorismate--pyruvate lyase [Eubacteriales bacterium]